MQSASLGKEQRARSKEQGVGKSEVGSRKSEVGSQRSGVAFALPVICPQGTLGRTVEMDPFSYICVLTSIVAGLAVTPARERVRPVAPDPRPHPALLGARALDGEHPFNDHHHLVDPIPLAQLAALDAVPVSLVAGRAVDPLPRHRPALSHQPG